MRFCTRFAKQIKCSAGGPNNKTSQQRKLENNASFGEICRRHIYIYFTYRMNIVDSLASKIWCNLLPPHLPNFYPYIIDTLLHLTTSPEVYSEFQVFPYLPGNCKKGITFKDQDIYPKCQFHTNPSLPIILLASCFASEG